MAGSLRRWGQLSPVVACMREEKLELLDGFKRFAAARQVGALTNLSVRVLEVDEGAQRLAWLNGTGAELGSTLDVDKVMVATGRRPNSG